MLRPQQPIVLSRWWDDLTLVLPRSGSAATAYYRTFPSETIARWMEGLLGPGMTAVDAGAHVGVYSMLAARLVGPDGVVHAIEPQAECTALVDRSRELNALANLRTHTLALSDSDGDIELTVDPRTMGGFAGSRTGEATATVPALTLDSFARAEGLDRIDLLKLDAAGNEVKALQGAGRLLDGAVGHVICKLYHRDVVTERFGLDAGPEDVTALLQGHGYTVELPDGRIADRRELKRAFAGGEYTVPVLARSVPPR
jgi:FkbM family methyltransferase